MAAGGWRRRVAIWAGVAVACTVAAVARGLAFERFEGETVPAAVGFYLLTFGITAAFSFWVCRELDLPTSLLLLPLTPGQRWRRFLTWGVAPGLAISLINATLYRALGSTATTPGWLASVEGHMDIVILSASAATAEETFYRLFAVPFLVVVALRMRGWRPRFGFEEDAGDRPRERPSAPVLWGAVLVSSLLFALGHPLNPLPALGFGLLLSWIYLRGGWESAVTAHFLGNYLLFAGIYL